MAPGPGAAAGGRRHGRRCSPAAPLGRARATRATSTTAGRTRGGPLLPKSKEVGRWWWWCRCRGAWCSWWWAAVTTAPRRPPAACAWGGARRAPGPRRAGERDASRAPPACVCVYVVLSPVLLVSPPRGGDSHVFFGEENVSGGVALCVVVVADALRVGCVFVGMKGPGDFGAALWGPLGLTSKKDSSRASLPSRPPRAPIGGRPIDSCARTQ